MSTDRVKLLKNQTKTWSIAWDSRIQAAEYLQPVKPYRQPAILLFRGSCAPGHQYCNRYKPQLSVHLRSSPSLTNFENSSRGGTMSCSRKPKVTFYDVQHAMERELKENSQAKAPVQFSEKEFCLTCQICEAYNSYLRQIWDIYAICIYVLQSYFSPVKINSN